MAVVSVLVNRAAKDELMNHLLCNLFFYAAYYKFHFSAEHVPGVLNVAADPLFPSCSTGASDEHPSTSAGPVVAGAIGLELRSLDNTVQALLAQGVAPSTFSAYIRHYVAFCQQFFLSHFPLHDLNLCRFV